MASQSGLNWRFQYLGGRMVAIGRDPYDSTSEIRFFEEVPIIYGAKPDGFRIFYLLNGYLTGWQDAIRQILPETIFENHKRTFRVSDADYALMRLKAEYT